MTTRPATSKPSIALIGMRGCGKSTVGGLLATVLGGECVDTDELIADRAGRSIAVIFQDEGEAGFRERERDAIAKACRTTPAVISVGGGAVLDDRNVDALRSVASVVWLTAEPEVLHRRITSDPTTPENRPALTNQPGIAEVDRLLRQRTPLYEKAADFAINTAGVSPAEIAEMITKRLGLS